MSDMNLLVLSSHTRPQLSAPINHFLYCRKHGFDYLFDATPYRIKSPFDQKTLSIISTLKRSRADWVFWIDDDAYFMNFDIALSDFVKDETEADFIFCRSPVNPKGQWSIINAGIYFIRNTPETIAVLEEVMAAPNDAVRDAWDADRHGMYTTDGSDQEKLVYVFEQKGMMDGKVKIMDYSAFNARHYHFERAFDDHFICHLASHKDKSVPMRDMQVRFQLNKYLMSYNISIIEEESFKYSVFAKPAENTKRIFFFDKIRKIFNPKNRGFRSS
jgi:hypothetical protein